MMKILPLYARFSFILLLNLLNPLLNPQYSQCVKAQNNEVQALLSIKTAVGGSASILTSWDSSAPNPCNWTGVTCSSFNHVIALNMSGFGLQGKLPSDTFASLTELALLDLSYNYLASPLPASISTLTQLHDLNLSANAFTGEFPNDILRLTNLVELRIANNFFQGAVPEGISALSNLQVLWLGNNTLTSLPKSLSSLLHLTVLSAFSNTDIEMTLPPEWGAWVNLTYLNLHTMRLTGTLPSEWGANFTKLQRLHLYNNDLRGSIPESWKSMTASLKELRMSNNELSGIVPSWIGDLQNTADKVEFKCNFLQGPHPSSFNDSTTWKGNCFDTDSGSHNQICGDNISCKDFFAIKKSFPKGAIVGIVIVVVMILCGIIALVWWLRPFSTTHRRRRRNDENSGYWEPPPGVKRYTYKEIMKATKSFSKDCEIGEGGFGKVYVAHLDNKQVAIKRASDVSFQGIKEFRNELMLLSRLHHRHLVHLEGFCDDKDEQILIYEYMKNGNLHRHLFDNDALTLNWYRRLEIALSVAQGLDYLHTFADPPVIHRDVKPSNILLDSNMIAKVSDFGISKSNPEMDTHVSTRPAGTAGYLDPEYFLRRQLTTASDVYGYGVVLLELLTGQVAIDHRRTEDYNLVGWVRGKLKWNGDPRAIIDARLGSKYPVYEYKEVIEIALQCTIYDRNDRPKMQVVVEKLEQILRRLQPPAEHMMILPPPPSLTSLSSNNEQDQTTNSLNDIKTTYSLGVEPR